MIMEGRYGTEKGILMTLYLVLTCMTAPSTEAQYSSGIPTHIHTHTHTLTCMTAPNTEAQYSSGIPSPLVPESTITGQPSPVSHMPTDTCWGVGVGGGYWE